MPKVGPALSRLYGPLAPGFGARVEGAARILGDRPTAAKKIGLSVDQLNKIIGERATPNFAAIAALSKHSGRSLDWLAFAAEAAPRAESSTTNSFSETAGEVVWIDSLDNRSAFPFERDWLRRALPAIDISRLAALPGSGNAMEPTIGRDDLLLIDRRATRIVDGEIFAFTFGGDHVVRRTQREPDGSLTLRPDNRQFEPMTLTAAQAATVSVSGQVVWAGGRV